MRFRYLPILFLVGVSLWAQSRSTPQKVLSNSSRITEIRVSGSVRYQSSELVSAVGLKLGEDGTEAAMNAGAERLASSGMFTDVTFSYVSFPEGTRVEYKVHDVDTLFPARFDNFVWMPRAELVRALQQKRPLFVGEVPDAGEMSTRLAEDVKVILAEKNVAATVSVHPLAPQDGGKILGFIYKVEGVRTPIRSIEFPGADPEMAAALKPVAATRIGSDYTEAGLSTFARMDLLPEYLTRGFLRARFQSAEFTLTEAASNAVVVRLPVQEGLRYKQAGVEWSGNSAFTAKELANVLNGKDGSWANLVQLDEDLGRIRKVYGTKGYMEARLKALSAYDDSSRTVSFRIEVHEGSQYHMGTVRVEGSEAIEKKLRELWKLRAGDVFDSGYFQLFLPTLGQHVDLRGLRIGMNQSVNRESRTVDIVVRFTPQ